MDPIFGLRFPYSPVLPAGAARQHSTAPHQQYHKKSMRAGYQDCRCQIVLLRYSCAPTAPPFVLRPSLSSAARLQLLLPLQPPLVLPLVLVLMLVLPLVLVLMLP
jgi:hypothetical protein